MSKEIHLSEGVAKAIKTEQQKENKDYFTIITLLNIIEKQQKEIEEKDAVLKCASEVIENSVLKSKLINLMQEIEDENTKLLLNFKFSNRYYDNDRKIRAKAKIDKTKEFLKKLKEILEDKE